MNNSRKAHVPSGLRKAGVNGLYDMAAMSGVACRPDGQQALTAGGSWWYAQTSRGPKGRSGRPPTSMSSTSASVRLRTSPDDAAVAFTHRFAASPFALIFALIFPSRLGYDEGRVEAQAWRNAYEGGMLAGALVALISFGAQAKDVDPGITTIEVRLEAKGEGESYNFASGGIVKLESRPVADGAALHRDRPGPDARTPTCRARSTSNCCSSRAAPPPGRRRKDLSRAPLLPDAGRHRAELCCLSAPQKDIYDRGLFLFGVAEAEANRFSQRLMATIRKAQAAVKNRRPQHFGGLAARALGRPLSEGAEIQDARAARWRKARCILLQRHAGSLGPVDLAQAAGNREAPLDADPIAATSSLTLKSFRVGPTSRARRTAVAPRWR